MGKKLAIFGVVATVTACSGYLTTSTAQNNKGPKNAVRNVQVGPRPYYLVDAMEPGPLKTALQQCSEKPLKKSDFSIGHRGAALQFPEHTKQSYEAGARMGAGILECDVTFTKDAELVCRHGQCDLHTTTNILETDLAGKCRVPFTPAVFDASGKRITPATARCCTTDLTLAEFKTLKGKMDASNPNATTPEEFLGGTPSFRTDLYATGGTLLTHKESIALFDSLDTKFTPELKGVDRASTAPGTPPTPIVENGGFGQSGLNQQTYARKVIQEYIDAGIDPRDVFPQSFNIDDVLLWVKEFPAYGQQAVFLDDIPTSFTTSPPTLAELEALKQAGVNILAPAMPHLLTTNAANEVVPSTYAERAKQAGLKLISWTTERSGRIVEDVLNVPSNQFYYQTTIPALTNDGDILNNIHVLAQDVGIIGLFSDWAGTTTYYANCMGK
jgi:glycerophosphoryl diester phosphodiesterase